MKKAIGIIVLKLVTIFLLVSSCATTDPTKVSGEDAQKILATKFGTIVDVQAVSITGKKSVLSGKF
jgi:outer membrane lipoprotein SlyB